VTRVDRHPGTGHAAHHRVQLAGAAVSEILWPQPAADPPDLSRIGGEIPQQPGSSNLGVTSAGRRRYRAGRDLVGEIPDFRPARSRQPLPPVPAGRHLAAGLGDLV
jgi:hypothetical protein